MSAASDKGKWAEREARKWFDARSLKDSKFAVHRYPDAKAARGALAAQPADYLVAQSEGTFVATGSKINGRTYHIEVKETAEERRLPKGKVRQFGMLLKFHLAGIAPHVLVYRSAHNDWVVFSAAELFCHDVCPPSFAMDGLPTYPTAAAALESIFQ